MKKNMKKAIALILALFLVSALMPLRADAAGFDIEAKDVTENQPARSPGDLSDGEIYTYAGAAADPLPSTDFTVSLSALGQQYATTVTTVQRFNIVLLLDVSGSMDSTRKTNMVNAANGAIDTLYGNGNKLSVVTFATTSQVDRALSEKDLELKLSGSSSTSGAVDSILISLGNRVGGTNIQAGLVTAYNVLDAADDEEAIPVIILLSDGAPTYSYSDIDAMYTGSTGRSGDGTSSGTSYAARTVAQAAYLKVRMPGLQIYTIPFSFSVHDSNYDVATATMDPTDANVAQLSSFSTYWNNAVSTVPSADRPSMERYYPNGSYSASNSASSLSEALTRIITDMRINTPIDETRISGVLDDASFLWMQYQVGTGYAVSGSTMTVSLKGIDYQLTKSGNSFVYATPATDPGYNEKLTRLTATVSDTGLLIWKIPGKALPCNTPEGAEQVLASPVTLSFRVHFDLDAQGLTAGTYPTSSSCAIHFTPTDDNPHYYTTDGHFYAVTYPYPGSDSYSASNLPVLTGLAVSASESLLESSFISNPASAASVTAYTDLGSTTSRTDLFYGSGYTVYVDANDRLSLNHNGRTVQFEGATRYQARATFTTGNKSDAGQYTVSGFSDGRSLFGDAAVTSATVNGNGTANVTVTYDQGKRSVEFKNVSFAESTVKQPSGVTAKFFCDISWFSVNSVTMTELNGNAVSNIPISYNQIASSWFSGYRIFDITAVINGITYLFEDVRFDSYGSDSYSSTVSAVTLATVYTATQASQYYYFTEVNDAYQKSGPYANYQMQYNAQTKTLSVSLDTGSGWMTDGTYTEGADTVIRPNDKNGYTVTQFNADGVSKTVTVYYVENGKLYKTVSVVIGINGVDLRSGVVSGSLTNSGYITISASATPEEIAQEVGASATLKSTYNTAFTTATSQQVAYVYVFFTVTEAVTDINITLSAPASPGFLAVPAIVEVKNLDTNDVTAALPATIEGHYRIKYELTFNKLPVMPELTDVLFESAGFLYGSLPGNLAHGDGYVNQKVSVRFDTATGH